MRFSSVSFFLTLTAFFSIRGTQGKSRDVCDMLSARGGSGD